MPKFIKVTAKHGDLICHINVDKIEYVFSRCLSANQYETRVVTHGSYNNYTDHVVEETVEEIMEMING